MSRLPVTGSQTVGPFFRIGMAALFREELAGPEVPGERATVHGRVLDGDGKGIPDAVIEIWQADALGRYAEEAQSVFAGFGRVPTSDRGEFRFTTIKPGRVAGAEGVAQAPHLVVIVFMRGLLRHVCTRMYFPDQVANENDAILQLAPAERRDTLIAKRESADSMVFRWNLHMQGENETVFFEV